MKKAPYLIAIMGFFFFAIQDGRAGPGHAHGPDGSHLSSDFETSGSSDTIILSENAIQNLQIRTTQLRKRKEGRIESLYGRVIVDPRRLSRLSAGFVGEVEQVYVLPGNEVRRGEELLRVRPFQAGSSPAAITAPSSGFVTELTASRGTGFEPADILVEVSDLSFVMFEGDLFESSQVQALRDSRECFVTTRRHPGESFPCRVETVDAKFTGNPPAGHVHVVIKNDDHVLKPGMTGKLHLTLGEVRARMLLPKEAVLGNFENRFVYLREGNTFLRKEVKLGGRFGETVEVLGGIQEGDLIVTQGHYQLQFASSSEGSKNQVHDHGDHIHDHEDKDHVHDQNTYQPGEEGGHQQKPIHSDHEHNDHEHNDHEHNDHEHNDHEHGGH